MNPLMDKSSKSELHQAIRARTKEVREASGDTQPKTAEKLGIDWTTYAKYETRSVIPVELLDKFCEMYKVPVEYILTGRTSQGLGELERRFYALPEKSQEYVIKAIELEEFKLIRGDHDQPTLAQTLHEKTSADYKHRKGDK